MLDTPMFADLERGEEIEEIKIAFSNNIIRVTQRVIKAIIICLTLISFILVVHIIEWCDVYGIQENAVTEKNEKGEKNLKIKDALIYLSITRGP